MVSESHSSTREILPECILRELGALGASHHKRGYEADVGDDVSGRNSFGLERETDS